MKFLASMYRLRGNTYARVGLAEKAIEDLSFAIALDRDHGANALTGPGSSKNSAGARVRSTISAPRGGSTRA